MSERKAITLAIIAGVLVTTAACAAVVVVGGGTELGVATALLVAGLAVDQIAKLIMNFDSPKRQ